MQIQNTNTQIQCIHKYPKQPPKVYCTPTYSYMYYRWVLDLIPLGYSNEGRSVLLPEGTTAQLTNMCLTLSPLVTLTKGEVYRAKCITPRVNNSPTYKHVLDLIPLGYSNEGRSVSSKVYYSRSEQLPNLQTCA